MAYNQGPLAAPGPCSNRLEACVAAGACLHAPEAMRPYAIGGAVPLAALVPANSREVAQVVATAAQHDLAIVTWTGCAPPPHTPAPGRPFVVIDLKAMDRLLDENFENLTVRFQAGTPVSALKAHLGDSGLYYPVESPGCPTATLGGALGMRTVGPRRLGYGTARDWVLGLEVVTATGQLVELGAQTVKNVAGLDLTKLFVGARGTLGVITAATLRLVPTPAATCTLMARFSSATAAQSTLPPLLRSPSGPVAVDLLNAAACKAAALPGWEQAGGDAAVLLVCLEGDADGLPWRKSDAWLHLSVAATAVEVLEGASEPRVWQARSRIHPHLLQTEPDTVVADAGVPLAGAPELLAAAQEALPAGWLLTAHAGTGQYQFLLPATAQTPTQLAQLRWAAQSLGGHLTISQAPPALLGRIPARAPRPADRLDAALQHALDPKGLMNPHLRDHP